MWKKILFIFFVLLAIAGIGGSVYFYLQFKDASEERLTLLTENGQLQNKVEAIGPFTTVYTVKAKTKPGQEIKLDQLVQMSVPLSATNETFILDPNKIVGMQFKIEIMPKTPITTSLVMTDDMEDTMYERDLVMDSIPIGLSVGDYVDLRVVLPYGEELIVIPHKRIYKLVDNVIELKLNPAELAKYTSLTRDQALYTNKGLTVYITKYVEPGIQTDTYNTYPVRKDMESIVNADPNIKNKDACINTAFRDIIEERLAPFNDTTNTIAQRDGGLLSSGGTKEHSAIKAANKLYVEQLNSGEYDPNVSADGSTGDASTGEILSEFEQSTGEAVDSLEGSIDELNDALPAETQAQVQETQAPTQPAVDSQGNQVTAGNENERANAEGEDVFSNEAPIE